MKDTVERQHEDQASISRWATETFGEPGSDDRVAARVNEEIAELLRAITAGKSAGEIAEEAADAAIVLCRLGKRVGVELVVGPTGRGLELSPLFQATTAARAILWFLDFGALLQGRDGVAARSNEGRRQALFDAWVAILDVFGHLGIDAQDAIDIKMAINRQRIWKKDGTGHGYHVRVKDPGPAKPAHGGAPGEPA